MSRRKTIITSVIAGLVVLFGLFYIDLAFYPFTSVSPNYSDVDAAFSKLQFPADWQQTASSENKGIAGRDCDPFNTSGCFSKSKTFKVGKENQKQLVTGMLNSAGCTNISEELVSSGQMSTDRKNTLLKCISSKQVAYIFTLDDIEGVVGVSAATNY